MRKHPKTESDHFHSQPHEIAPHRARFHVPTGRGGYWDGWSPPDSSALPRSLRSVNVRVYSLGSSFADDMGFFPWSCATLSLPPNPCRWHIGLPNNSNRRWPEKKRLVGDSFLGGRILLGRVSSLTTLSSLFCTLSTSALSFFVCRVSDCPSLRANFPLSCSAWRAARRCPSGDASPFHPSENGFCLRAPDQACLPELLDTHVLK